MEVIFGNHFTESLKQEKLLLVGVGGIGCEILKQLSLAPFRHIEIV
jgi:molybdopterin/thiamine biosynthesis adenylyltransferase